MKGKMFVLQITKNQPFVLQCTNPIGVSLMSAFANDDTLIKPIYGWVKTTNGARVDIGWVGASTTATVRIFVEEE